MFQFQCRAPELLAETGHGSSLGMSPWSLLMSLYIWSFSKVCYQKTVQTIHWFAFSFIYFLGVCCKAAKTEFESRLNNTYVHISKTRALFSYSLPCVVPTNAGKREQGYWPCLWCCVLILPLLPHPQRGACATQSVPWSFAFHTSERSWCSK